MPGPATRRSGAGWARNQLRVIAPALSSSSRSHAGPGPAPTSTEGNLPAWRPHCGGGPLAVRAAALWGPAARAAQPLHTARRPGPGRWSGFLLTATNMIRGRGKGGAAAACCHRKVAEPASESCPILLLLLVTDCARARYTHPPSRGPATHTGTHGHTHALVCVPATVRQVPPAHEPAPSVAGPAWCPSPKRTSCPDAGHTRRGRASEPLSGRAAPGPDRLGQRRRVDSMRRLGGRCRRRRASESLSLSVHRTHRQLSIH
jgi:hypothetical protein